MLEKKHIKNKIRNEKNSQKLLWLLAFLLVLALSGFGIVCYHVILNSIIKADIKNMERVSENYEQAIEQLLQVRWNSLEKIAERMRLHKREKASDLLNDLIFYSYLADCTKLSLVSDNAKVLNSNLKMEKDDVLLKICQTNPNNFIVRVQNKNEQIEGIGEYLLLGIQIKPYTIEGEYYSHLVARLEIDSLEKELNLNQTIEGSYSSVIDKYGNYIISIYRSYNSKAPDNFFRKLDNSEIEHIKIQEIREKMEASESFSFVFNNETEKQAVIAIPMSILNWYFLVFVPWQIFVNRGMQLVSTIILLVIFMLALIFIVTILFVRKSIKTFADQKKHHKELNNALLLAEQANNAKTVFLNSMSHDIRTPMNAIIGFTSLASSHIDDEKKVKDYLEKIHESSEHLLSLINDVLDMSRIESGKMVLTEKQENLKEILQYIQDIVQVEIKDKKIKWAMDLSEIKNENVFCDRLRLTQVLLNIISNAIKFTNDGGEVSVVVSEKKSTKENCATYTFKVKDNGIGIKKEFLKEIFEPFARERTTTVSGIQGTGLGLTITKSIVDMMGGKVSVSSEEKKGSEFCVVLDFKLCKNENIDKVKTDENVAQIPVADFKGKRILLVEDNKLNSEIAAEILKDVGFIVETAENGKEAVEMVEKANGDAEATEGENLYGVTEEAEGENAKSVTCESDCIYDAILMDVQMPVMDGYAASRAIRSLKNKTLSHIPIIAMTANAFEEDKLQAITAGMDGHIAKPIDIKVLLNTLKEILIKDALIK